MAAQPSQSQQNKSKKPELSREHQPLLLSVKIDDFDDSSLADVKDDWVIAVGPTLGIGDSDVSICVQKRKDITAYKRYKIGRVSKLCRSFKLVFEKESLRGLPYIPQQAAVVAKASKWSGKCNGVYRLLEQGWSEPVDDDNKLCIIEE